MLNHNFRLASQSIRTSKGRSFMTMLGIIVGVTSVITTVSLGEGVKQQVTSQVQKLGRSTITIRPGRVLNRDANGVISGVNVASSLGVSALTEQDYQAVMRTNGVDKSVPLSIVSGVVNVEDKEYGDAAVIGTNQDFPDVIKQKVEYGDFYQLNDQGKQVAVIGPKVAEQLFQENVPIGKTFSFRGEEFVIRGVFEQFASNPLLPGVDFNNTIFIPDVTARAITNNTTQIFQIFVEPGDPDQRDQVVNNLRETIKTTHGGQEDFTILTQEETLQAAATIVSSLTGLVAGIAAISLLVGGVGVMNIMLVSVTERTQEIGIRKAIGASNRQILQEFLAEAVVLSLAGGVIGVVVAFAVNFLFRVLTSLNPVITPLVVGLAVAVALIVGIIFGVAPALKAARKDPIEALRHQ